MQNKKKTKLNCVFNSTNKVLANVCYGNVDAVYLKQIELIDDYRFNHEILQHTILLCNFGRLQFLVGSASSKELVSER